MSYTPPYPHGNLSYNNEKYYVPDETVMRQKRMHLIKALIVYVVIAALLGAIIYFTLLATKTDQTEQARSTSTVQSVVAQIADVHTYINTGRENSYYAILTYTLNGQEYTSAEVRLNKYTEVGTYVKAYVSDSDPTHPYFSIPSAVPAVKNSGSALSTVMWVYTAAACSIGIFLIFRLILFLMFPYNKRFYRKEARMAVSSRDPDISRQYEDSNAHSFTSDAPVNSNAVISNGSASAQKKKSPLTYKEGLFFVILGYGIAAAFSIPIIISIMSYISQVQFKDNAVAIDTTIVSVRTERHTGSGKHKRTHTLYYATVEYTYEDTVYQRGEYQVSNTNRIGTTYTLYIDPNNPGDCRTAPQTGNLIWGNIGFVIPIIIGLFFGTGGLYYMIKAKKREREQGW